jgi:hypothetical protein
LAVRLVVAPEQREDDPAVAFVIAALAHPDGVVNAEEVVIYVLVQVALVAVILISYSVFAVRPVRL